MTLKEVIKGLECCQGIYNKKCDECPYKYLKTAAISVETCDSAMRADVLDMLKLLTLLVNVDWSE